MRSLLLTSVLLAAAPPPASEPLPAPPKLRLPAEVRPTGYRLELKVIPGEEKFSGTVEADLALSQPVDVVWLNGTNLEPGEATLSGASGQIAVKAVAVGKDHIAIIPKTKGQTIAAGNARLRLAYVGPLSKKDMGGLFQLEDKGEWYAYTHFEPIDARRAFPCFDEPSFKVPWQVTIHLRSSQQAFSNTPIESEKDDGGGMKTVVFAQTRPLPSYLVALAVGPYEVSDAGKWGQNKTPVRIVYPKGHAAEAKYAVETTGPVLEQLEKYFGRPYPYEKLDQIAVATQLGAMENPGLVTYGHQLILARADADTPGRQRSYASVCAHELAHMWFGDLVTTKWWDDIWLNEAFATWMSSKVIEAWKPKWDAPIGRVFSRNQALSVDSLASARQIRQPIASNDDIGNAFDGITYGKGAAVIDMFEHWVGVDTFQKGVQQYLTDHAYGNADAADFLGAISKAAGKDVATPFSTFLDQPGEPRVTIELQCPKAGAPKLALSQKRQLPLGSKGNPNQKWDVPVCVKWSSKGKEASACTMLDGVEGALELTGAKSCPEWLLPNQDMRGYYRANLTGALDWVKSLKAAGKKLTIAERVGAFSDLGTLTSSGELDLSAALDAIPLAMQEDNRNLIGAALKLVAPLGDDMVPDAQRPKYEAMLRAVFGPKAKKLGFNVGAKDDEDTRLVRPGLLVEAGHEGKDPELRKQAVTLAHAWLKDRHAVHADVIDAVLAIAADTDEQALHDALLEAATKETDRTDRLRILGGLASFRAPALVKKNLELMLNGPLDIRDTARMLNGAASDYRTRELAFSFVQENWDKLVEKLPKDSGSGMVFIAAGFCDDKHKAEAKKFFDGRSTKYLGGPRNFAIAMESIDLCIAYRARQRPNVVAWLEKYKAK